MNRFITGSWEHGGIAPEESVRATGAFISLAREWLRERGYPMPWAWVQEHGHRKGAHCHILLHVPPALDFLFRGRPRAWARKVLGGNYVGQVIRSDQLRFAATASLSAHAYEAELMDRVHYMLKCAPAALEIDLGLVGAGTALWGQPGLVYGKRAAVWQGTGRENNNRTILRSVE